MSVANQASPAPRVVIADDQTLVRSGFRLILGSAGIPVVAAAPGRHPARAGPRGRACGPGGGASGG